MRIVLADDHALFRAGLRTTLSETFGEQTEVVEASDFAALKDVLAAAGHVDLILCDLRMPGMDPAQGVAELVRLRPETPVVVVSASEAPEDACRSIRQGARGYVPKSDSLAVLQRALDLILAGGLYVPALAVLAVEETPEDVAQEAPGSSGQSEAVPLSLPVLSSRQMMIFERLADGKPNKLIARELGIAEGTVKAQLRTVFRKLGVSNRTQAALFAAEVLGRDTGASRALAARSAARKDAEDLAGEQRTAPHQPGLRGKLRVLNFPS